MLEIILLIENDTERNRAKEIWENYYTRLVKVAYKILKNDYDAEDAAMDAIKSVVDNIKTFVGLPEIDTACLLSIYVRNAAFKIYNKNKRRLGACVDEEDIDTVSDAENVESKVISHLDYEYASEQLINMKEIYSQPFILRHHFGYSTKTIAVQLNLKQETVKKRIQRARSQLVERMEQHYE